MNWRDWAEQNLNMRRWYNDEGRAECPFCHSIEYDLQMNLLKMVYYCRACGKKGTLNQLRYDLQHDFVPAYTGYLSLEEYVLQAQSLLFHQANLWAREALLRRLPLEVVKEYRLGLVDGEKIKLYNKDIVGILFPFYSSDKKLLAFHVRLLNPEDKDNPFQITSEQNKFLWFPPGIVRNITPKLYPLHKFDVNAQEVFIASGEFDCLTLRAFGYEALTSVTGEGGYKDILPFLHDKDVYLIPDTDVTGLQVARNLAKEALSLAKSVTILDLTSYQVKDINELYQIKKDDFEAIMRSLKEKSVPYNIDKDASGIFVRGNEIRKVVKRSKEITTQRLANFAIHPLNWYVAEQEDLDLVIRCYVANHQYSGELILTKTDTASVANFRKALRTLPLFWYGTDNDLQALTEYLLERLHFPPTPYSSVIGCFQQDNQRYVLLPDKCLSDPPLPIVWFHKSRYVIDYLRQLEHLPVEELSPDELSDCIATFLAMNIPAVTYPILAWGHAALVAPYIRQIKGTFPLLYVCGNQSAGKSTTLRYGLLPLLGFQQPATLFSISSSSQFPVRLLLSASNAFPIVFDETNLSSLHVDIRNRILSFLKDLYDALFSGLGTEDRSMQTYLLTAPTVLISMRETLPSDLEERAIVCVLPGQEMKTQNPYALQRLMQMPLRRYATTFLNYLVRDFDMTAIIQDTNDLIKTLLMTQHLPSRVWCNLWALCYGYMTLCAFLRKHNVTLLDTEQASHLLAPFENYLKYGYQRQLIETFLLDLDKMYAQNKLPDGCCFIEGNHLFIQLSQAFHAWEPGAQFLRRDLASEAMLRRQLEERTTRYVVAMNVQKYVNGKMLSYVCIDLQKLADRLSDQLVSFLPPRTLPTRTKLIKSDDDDEIVGDMDDIFK